MGCLDIQVLDLYVKTCINTAISWLVTPVSYTCGIEHVLFAMSKT